VTADLPTLAQTIGVPDADRVTHHRNDDKGRTYFYYDDGRDPWVLPGIEEVER
jgi:hypothetical protein